MILISQLQRIMPHMGARAGVFIAPLNAVAQEFEINTPQRLSAFLAQLAHESGEFRYMREIADGSAYEGRADLGNTEPGDGRRFPGRSPMQITGRKNTRLCSLAIYGDERLLDTPQLLETPLEGCRAAGWFWREGAGLNLSRRAISEGVQEGCDLNDLADACDFYRNTLAINGGTNGWGDRVVYFDRAKQVLGA
jgi:putative chitinase